MNRAILVGRVGKDPETKTTQSGSELANLSLATSESYKNKAGEWVDKTEWHKVVIFNEATVKYVKNNVSKGDMLCIEGKIKTRKWQDQSGSDKYSTEIVIENFDGSIRRLNKKEAGETKPATRQPAQLAPEDLDDEIPF